MLNPDSPSYTHMTPARYRRVLRLLDRLRVWRRSQEFYIRELYGLLSKQDRGKDERTAIVNCLRRLGLLRRVTVFPVRYRIVAERIDDAMARIQSALDESKFETIAARLQAAS